MITRDQIPMMLEHPVYDVDGNKLGDAKHVYYDDVTGEPDWLSVKTGMFGTSESFVPIHDASMVQDHLEVAYSKNKVKDAPHVDVDSGGHLSQQEEHRLYEHYNLGGNAVGRFGPGDRDQGGMGTAGAAGTMAGTGMGLDSGTTSRSGAMDEDLDTGRDTGMRGDMDMDTGMSRETTGARTGSLGDDAMTRSEEHLHVGTERHEAGRARLRKYVVIEEEQQTIPVTHDEVRIEREPITAANRDAAMSGPEISEEEREITLFEERAVVETRAEPVERVRLTTEEHTEEETVTGRVRKERIEAELPDDKEDR